MGLPVLKTTDKNQEAADDATMQMLKEYCVENRPELVRLFEAVQEYRKWGKLKSTYIDGYLTYINEVTGRIHPDLMPLGTEKIDGAIALIMALDRAIRCGGESGASVYDNRGILFI